MGGNSPIRYAKLERALRRGGATLVSINGSHHNWIYRGVMATIPVHKGLVKAGYVGRLRKAWYLKPSDGVSDNDFWDGNWP